MSRFSLQSPQQTECSVGFWFDQFDPGLWPGQVRAQFWSRRSPNLPDSMGRLYESLLRIRRADITAPAGFLLFNHPERNTGGGRRNAAVNSRSHGDQGVNFVIGEPDAAGLFNPVSSADLATASHRHSQADQMLLSFTQ